MPISTARSSDPPRSPSAPRRRRDSAGSSKNSSHPLDPPALVVSFNGNQVARRLRLLTPRPVRRGPFLSANRSGRLGLTKQGLEFGSRSQGIRRNQVCRCVRRMARALPIPRTPTYIAAPAPTRLIRRPPTSQLMPSRTANPTRATAVAKNPIATTNTYPLVGDMRGARRIKKDPSTIWISRSFAYIPYRLLIVLDGRFYVPRPHRGRSRRHVVGKAEWLQAGGARNA